MGRPGEFSWRFGWRFPGALVGAWLAPATQGAAQTKFWLNQHSSPLKFANRGKLGWQMQHLTTVATLSLTYVPPASA